MSKNIRKLKLLSTIWISMGLGAMSSFTHCAGMCGPIQATLSRHFGNFGTSLYHTGRILGYGSLGIIAGSFSGSLNLIQEPMYKKAAMTLMAVLYLFFAISFLSRKNFVEPLLQKLFPHRFFGKLVNSEKPIFLLPAGFIGAYLPCPTTIGALGYAMYLQNPILSGVNMMAFGISTLPVFIVMSLKAIRRPAFTGIWIPKILGLVFVGLSVQKFYLAWFAHTPGACH